jgi:hypothetical protein
MVIKQKFNKRSSSIRGEERQVVREVGFQKFMRIFEFTLPNTRNSPSLAAQFLGDRLVPRLIHRHFVSPEAFLGLWLAIALWATVPEAAVHKNT